MTRTMKYYWRLFIFLMPILMLPVVVDPFDFGKNWLLMALTVVGLLMWAVEMVIDKRSEIKVNKMTWLLVAMLIWAWVGWWRMSVGLRMESVTNIGGIGTLTAGVIWFFLWQQISSEVEKKKQLNWLTASGLLLVVLSVIIFLLPSQKMPIVWPKNNPLVSIGTDWSLAGSLLSEGVVMLFLVLEWAKRLINKLSPKQDEKESGYLLEAVVTGILTLALMLDIFRIFKAGWVSLDGTSAWVIAVEAFKRNPVWGMGMGNFVSAFTAYRPDSYNLTKYWVNGFKFSSMGLLQLWTELGVVGLVLVGLMSGVVVRLKKNFDWVRVAVMAAVVAFLPFNVLGVLLLVWSVAEVVDKKRLDLTMKVGGGFNLTPWLLGGLVVLFSLGSGYWMTRTLLGEMAMKQSLLAASKNDGGGTYNLQIKAIGMNPYSAEYRRVYSQTNLALANSLLSNKELSEEDKQKASVLIQQSVREAKAAISLETNNSGYWINLATIYRQLVGVVDGSADWSFQAYQQAVALEPANPLSKLEMGGLLYAAGRYDEADRVFEQVVTIKSDYPNGWYNWAYSAKKLNKLQDAVSRLTQAVALVPVNSGDYDKASKELLDWKKELEAVNKQQPGQEEKTPETLKTEGPLPTGSKKDKVVVPNEELSPPSTEVTPTVTQAP